MAWEMSLLYAILFSLKVLPMVTLATSKLFGRLKAEELTLLTRNSQERTFSAGQEIFKEGGPGDGVYVVKIGLVEISAIIGQNVRRVFAQVGPGDFFGEMAVIENMPRSASAVAAEDSVVYFIPNAEMLNLIERSPALALELLREISHRLREFNRRYLQEILQAERLAAIGSFARSIVHDLKNPLNIIGLTAEIASAENVPQKSRQRSKARILRQVTRINDLIGEILEFTQGARPVSGFSPTDFGAFAKQMVEEIRVNTEGKEIEIALENSPPPLRLQFDPKRLSRVFHNLVNNAADMMSEGGKIILRFHSNETEVVTEIEDTGPGVAPEIAEKLFQPFVTYGKTHGTGLGLSICKRIVEDHRGRIWARNEPGRGAVFSFSLPLVIS